MGNIQYKEKMQNEWDVIPITNTMSKPSSVIIKTDENSPEGKNAAAIDETINQCKENGKYDNVDPSQVKPLGGGSLKRKKKKDIYLQESLRLSLGKSSLQNKEKQVKMNIKKNKEKNRRMNKASCVIEYKDKKFYYSMNEKMEEIDVIKKFIKDTNYKNEHMISLLNRSTREKNYYVIKNTKQNRIKRVY
jgi:hypothetical protein